MAHWRPAHAKKHRQKACRRQIPPSCPKDFYMAQNGKHSDLTCLSSTGDTVMAVAADSHRDFLIPEAYRPAVPPTTDAKDFAFR